jgi:hypothetical protein
MKVSKIFQIAAAIILALSIHPNLSCQELAELEREGKKVGETLLADFNTGKGQTVAELAKLHGFSIGKLDLASMFLDNLGKDKALKSKVSKDLKISPENIDLFIMTIKLGVEEEGRKNYQQAVAEQKRKVLLEKESLSPDEKELFEFLKIALKPGGYNTNNFKTFVQQQTDSVKLDKIRQTADKLRSVRQSLITKILLYEDIKASDVEKAIWELRPVRYR